MILTRSLSHAPGNFSKRLQKHNQQTMNAKRFCVLLPLLSLMGCSSVSDPRVLIGDNHEPDELTRITENLLAAAKRFNESARAMNSMAVRLDGLSRYRDELAPHLTDSFRQLYCRYVELRLAAFASDAPSVADDTAQFDLFLQRRWQPDAQVLATEWTEHDDERWVVVTEVLLDSKIYTGQHAETRFVYRLIDGAWLLDDVICRYRYTYDDATWQGPDGTRDLLRERISCHEKELRAMGKGDSFTLPTTGS